MENLRYALPDKAKALIEELAHNELFQVSFYLYLSFCCSNSGYYHAADYFMDRSKGERHQYTRLTEFLQVRGIEPEVPAIEAPKITFTDLKSGIKAAFELEVVVIEKYDEAIREIQKLDIMAYLKLCGFMDGFQYTLDEMGRLWKTFGALDKVEDQMEAERQYFGIPMTEDKVIG